MKGIVKLAVFLAAIFVAFHYGRPHLERLLGENEVGELGGGDPDMRCVARTQDASQEFANSVIEHARPPANLDRWAGSFRLNQGRVDQARDACGCASETCAIANEALDSLESFMRQVDDDLHGNRPLPDMHRDLDRIDRQIDQARRKAH